MRSPIQKKVGAIFIPVRNIEAARDWYCELLGISAEGEIIAGHLYVLPLDDGNGLVLDSKIYPNRSTGEAPLFHFNTENIEEAYTYLKEKQINIVSKIEHGHFFNFKDPDGNVLMVSKC